MGFFETARATIRGVHIQSLWLSGAFRLYVDSRHLFLFSKGCDQKCQSGFFELFSCNHTHQAVCKSKLEIIILCVYDHFVRFRFVSTQSYVWSSYFESGILKQSVFAQTFSPVFCCRRVFNGRPGFLCFFSRGSSFLFCFCLIVICVTSINWQSFV